MCYNICSTKIVILRVSQSRLYTTQSCNRPPSYIDTTIQQHFGQTLLLTQVIAIERLFYPASLRHNLIFLTYSHMYERLEYGVYVWLEYGLLYRCNITVVIKSFWHTGKSGYCDCSLCCPERYISLLSRDYSLPLIPQVWRRTAVLCW